MIRVSGWRRVPEPPARMTPFTRAMLTALRVNGQHEEEHGEGAGERNDDPHASDRRKGGVNDPCPVCKETVRFGRCLRGPAAPASPSPPRACACSRRRRRSTWTRSSSTSRTARRRRTRRLRARISARRARAARSPSGSTASARRGGATISRRCGERAPDVVVLPKAESAEEVAAVVELLPAGAGLEVQIETARGLVEVERIAALGGPLEALVFGPGDFAASIGVPMLTIGAASVRLRARPDRRRRPGVRPPGGRRPLRRARRRRRAAGSPPSARSRSAATASG